VTKLYVGDVASMSVVWTERCPVKRSEVVHKYSPGQHHNDQYTAPPSQLDSEVDDQEDGAASSDGAQPVVRGRYGRRYDPVMIIERPTVTEQTGHSEQLAVTTSGGSIPTRPSLILSLGVQLALSLLTLDWRTAAFRLLHCCVDCLSASVVR